MRRRDFEVSQRGRQHPATAVRLDVARRRMQTSTCNASELRLKGSHHPPLSRSDGSGNLENLAVEQLASGSVYRTSWESWGCSPWRREGSGGGGRGRGGYGYLINVSKYLMGGNEERARLSSVVLTDRTRDNGQRKFHLNKRKYFFYCAGVQTLEQVAQRVRGPSHGMQSFMNGSNTGLSYGLQFFKNCSSMDPSHGLQSFRNGLLQLGSPTGSQFLPENLLQCGLLSTDCSSCQEPAPAWAFHETMDNQQLDTTQGTQGNGEILSGKSRGRGLKRNITVVVIKFCRDNSYEQVQGRKLSSRDGTYRHILPSPTSNQRKCRFEKRMSRLGRAVRDTRASQQKYDKKNTPGEKYSPKHYLGEDERRAQDRQTTKDQVGDESQSSSELVTFPRSVPAEWRDLLAARQGWTYAWEPFSPTYSKLQIFTRNEHFAQYLSPQRSSTAGKLAAASPVPTAALLPPAPDQMLQGIVGNYMPGMWVGRIFGRKQKQKLFKGRENEKGSATTPEQGLAGTHLLPPRLRLGFAQLWRMRPPRAWRRLCPTQLGTDL
ncbi:hypothetical protein QYF61_003938 [Mycteria americana]|uniref:Uncharacterized protein n=1 Tax=Mycteria americana TaxID=33587 RepID=A0AAN7RYY1_MYCAM|nr:hypothetical protein QYF61_003938 [Mycteria americana]